MRIISDIWGRVMFALKRKVNKISPTLFTIGDDTARVEYSPASNTWNTYGMVEQTVYETVKASVTRKFIRLGQYSTSDEAITAAKQHRVK